jgi:hypothetical protein
VRQRGAVSDVTPIFPAQLCQHREALAHRVDAGEVESVPAVPPCGHSTKRGVAVASDHDGDLPTTDRLRIDAYRSEATSSPSNDATSSRQTTRIAANVFGGALAATRERDAQRREFLPRPADSDSEGQPPARESVEACRLLGEQQRSVLREQQHARCSPIRRVAAAAKLNPTSGSSQSASAVTANCPSAEQG